MNEHADIIRNLGVSPKFELNRETERRIEFLADYLRFTGAKACVLGISGGVDSLTAALLAQAAVRRVMEAGQKAPVHRRAPSVRCPERGSGRASLSRRHQARQVVTVNVAPAANEIFAAARIGLETA